MTTDTEGLIERLRELAGQIDPCFVGGRDAKLLLASANEIERLSALQQPALRELLPADAQKLLAEMIEGWSHPAQQYAADCGIPEKRVRELHRAFHALGWADRHPYHNEDDSLIRGSGYSLSPKGCLIRAHLGSHNHDD